MMKNCKVSSIFALTLLLIFILSNTVSASELRIINKTSDTISRVYLSRYGRNFSSRVQNSHYIPGGKIFMLGNIPTSRLNRYWNLRIVFSNGKSYDWKRVDLYSRRDMTIYYRGSSLHTNWN